MQAVSTLTSKAWLVLVMLAAGCTRKHFEGAHWLGLGQWSLVALDELQDLEIFEAERCRRLEPQALKSGDRDRDRGSDPGHRSGITTPEIGPHTDAPHPVPWSVLA
jgi:hypothetical protein